MLYQRAGMNTIQFTKCVSGCTSKATVVVTAWLPPLLLLSCYWATAAAAHYYDCNTAHPWIDEVIRFWAQPAYDAARASNQTPAEAIEAIKAVKWGQYYTGKDEVVLTYNEAEQRYDVAFYTAHKHNQPYKPAGMRLMIQRAINLHSLDLARVLKKRELRFIFGTEDFPIMNKGSNSRLPSFQMCGCPTESIDIPVPDFTFEGYPAASYVNTSWWAAREVLLPKAKQLPWHKRTTAIFMRHDRHVGYRKVLYPALEKLVAAGKDKEVLGAPSNVQDSGWSADQIQNDNFVWLDNWCQYKYLVHTSGFSYSAGLKYKLACGSILLHFVSPKFYEFYYPALKPGTHYIELPEATEEELPVKAWPHIHRAITHTEALHAHDGEVPPMGRAARDFAEHQLSERALACYWYKALVAYSKLYYAEKAEDVPKLVNLDEVP